MDNARGSDELSDMPLRPGEVLLGKYRVERLLGRGGMGVVVAARHLELEELFAIKLLLPEALEHEQAVERFLREARAAARLKSEHVTRVHDVGKLESGAPYMVMEHLDGMDLKSYLRSKGPLPVEEAVDYAIQACQALAEAHVHGIVHRDIKPANLFLTRRLNGSACVKVLDFGVSKQRPKDGLALTQTGMPMGSPLYMSPEQMARAKEVDPRSDIWGLGITLFQLLTGHLPFRAESLVELVAVVLSTPALPPSTLQPGVPPALDALVLRCLEKAPERRFQSMGELAAALGSVLGGPGSGARPVLPSVPGAYEATNASLPRQLESSSGVSGTSTMRSWGQTNADASRRRRRVGIVAGAVAGFVALVGVVIGLVGRESSVNATKAAATPMESAVSVEPSASVVEPLPRVEKTAELPVASATVEPEPSPQEMPKPAPSPLVPAPSAVRSAKPVAPQPTAKAPKHEEMF